MEDYSQFCETARVYTDVHAGKAPVSQPVIELDNAGAAEIEEFKQQKKCEDGVQIKSGQVLGQVTNNFSLQKNAVHSESNQLQADQTTNLQENQTLK